MRKGARFNRFDDSPGPVSDFNPWGGVGRRSAAPWDQAEEPRVIRDMPGQEKMSQVILEFAQPLLGLSEEIEWKMTILDVAVMAWNYSLLPGQEQEEACGALQDAFDSEEARDIFEFLVQRKEELFPANHRVVVDYSVRQSGNKLKFNVVSTPQPDV